MVGDQTVAFALVLLNLCRQTALFGDRLRELVS
jgi:hypothetical protein